MIRIHPHVKQPLAILVVLATGGCDAVFGLADRDAPILADAVPDAVAFSAPRPITELWSTGMDGEPTLTADMTEIYFKSNRPGGKGLSDIWSATRATASDAWSTPSSVAALSTSDNETAPRIAQDGLTIWFQRNPSGGAGATLMSTRASRTSTWSTPVTVNEFIAGTDGEFGSATATLLVGYLTSHRTSTRAQLFRSTRAAATDPWGTPTEVAELISDTGVFSQSPWGSPDDLSIIFSSDRLGTHGSGDLWLATRASVDEPFGTPVNLSETNSADFDADPWISPDLRHIVFVNTSTGNYELYEASR